MQIHSMKDGLIQVDEASLHAGDNAPGGMPDVSSASLIGGESRRIFHDQGYPWALNGKIYTVGGGEGSGIMIGRNLVLTALHCVDRSGGKQYFVPACYVDPPAGSLAEPFGRFEVVNFYRWMDIGNTHHSDEGAADYAVLKLAGEPNVGWAGTHGQVDRGWLNRKMWYHVGYPVNDHYGLKDHKNGRPSFEMDIAIKDIVDYDYVNPENLHLACTKFFTTADCEGGQSGGALFNIVDNAVMVAGVLSQEGATDTDSGFAACHPNLSKLVAWCRQNA